MNNKSGIKAPLINEIIKHGSVLLTAHILKKSYSGEKLFENQALYEILFFLIGVVVYHELVINIIPPINENI